MKNPHHSVLSHARQPVRLRLKAAAFSRHSSICWCMGLVAAGSALLSESAHGATRTWQGTTTATMNTASNWSGGVVPTTGDQMLFNGTSTQNSPTFNAALATSGLGSASVVGIQLTSGQVSNLQITNVGTAGIIGIRIPAAVTTFIQIDSGAGALTVGDGAGTGTAFSFTTNGNATPTFLNNSANTATLTSDVLLGPGGSGSTVGWIFDGTGNWKVDGVISVGTSGTISVTKKGTGTTTLTGINTYTSSTTITAGTLEIGGAGQLQGGAYTAAISNAGTFRYNSTANQVLSGGFSGAGALVKNNTGTLTLSGTDTNTGTTTVNAGVLTFGKQVSLYNNTPASWTATNIVVNSGGTFGLNVGGTGEFTSANLDTLRALGTGSGGFLSGSALGIDTTNAGGNFTYASNIANPNSGANAIGLTKFGSGILTLNGTNTYTGVTTVKGGVALFANRLALYNNTPASWTATNIVVNSGGTLALSVGGAGEFTSSDLDLFKALGTGSGGFLSGSALGIDTTDAGGTFTYASDIGNPNAGANALGLTKSGTGTLVLTGALTYTGPTTVLGGSIEFSGTTNETLSGVISGTGGFTKSGSNTLTLTGNNTYTGNTSIVAGTLEIGGGGKLGNGTYAGAISNAGILLINTTAAQTLSGIISGNGSVVKDNTGTATLTGLNTYTGPTSVNNGILSINSLKSVNGGASALGAVTTVLDGPVNIGSTTTAGTLQYTGPGDTSDRVINLAGTTGGATLDQSGSGLLTLSGGVTATGAGPKTLTLTGAGSGVLSGAIVDNLPGTNLTSVSKTGTGTWKLSGPNSYTGATNISAGVLEFQTLSSAPLPYTQINVTAVGATLAVGAGGVGEWTQTDIDALLALSTGASLNSGSTVGIDTTDGNFSYDPTQFVGALNFAKYGANTLTLTTVPTYTGGTIIGGGTLVPIGGTNPLPTTTVNFAGNGTLALGSANQTVSTLSVSDGATGTITGSGGALTVTTNVFSVGSANTLTTQALVLTNLDSFTYNASAAAFNVGGSSASAAGSTGTLTLSKTSNTITALSFGVAGTLLGGSATANNVGLLNLGQSNGINASTINIGANHGQATFRFQSGLGANPSLTIRATDGTSRATMTLAQSGSNPGSASTVDLVTGVTGSSVLDASLGSLTIGLANRGSTQTTISNITGNFTMGGGTLNATSIILAQVTAGSGSSSATGLTNSGTFTTGSGTVKTSTLTLGDQNSTVAGTLAFGITATFNHNGGTLQAATIKPGNSAGTGTYSRNFNWNDGTIKNYDASTDLVVNTGLTVKLATLGTHSFNIGSGRTALISAVLADATSGGTLAKDGSGTLTLNTASTYSGVTTVNSGTILANNATGSATGSGGITVKSTATLGGTGAVSSAVTLESGGTLAPGEAGIESLATGALTLPAGATLAAEINSSGTPSLDVVNVTGNVTLGGNLTVTDIAGTPAAITLGTKLTLVSYTGTLTGTFNGKAEGSTFSVGSNLFKIRYADGGGFVTLEAVSATPYNSWALSKGLDGTNNGLTQDPDHDGLSNLLEFYLGGNPLGSSSAQVPAASTDGTYLILTFQRDDTASAAVTAQVAEYGSNLTGWTDVTLGTVAGTVTDGNGVVVMVADNGAAPDTVTVKIPKILSGGGKLFVRLKVSL